MHAAKCGLCGDNTAVCVLQLLSLVKALRDTGHFTAVSVTRPFEFEGQRKVEAADRMIAALEEAAHLVVVVEQVCRRHIQ